MLEDVKAYLQVGSGVSSSIPELNSLVDYLAGKTNDQVKELLNILPAEVVEASTYLRSLAAYKPSGASHYTPVIMDGNANARLVLGTWIKDATRQAYFTDASFTGYVFSVDTDGVQSNMSSDSSKFTSTDSGSVNSYGPDLSWASLNVRYRKANAKIILAIKAMQLASFMTAQTYDEDLYDLLVAIRDGDYSEEPIILDSIRDLADFIQQIINFCTANNIPVPFTASDFA